MKNPRKEKTEVDLTKPVSNLQVQDDDCFGKEWNPHNRDCSICADNELCGIKYQEVLKKKKQSYEKQHTPLDMANFDLVNMEKIVSIIKKYQEDEPLYFDELEELVGKAAKSKHKIAIREFIKLNIPKYNIIVKDNQVYVEEPKDTTTNG